MKPTHFISQPFPTPSAALLARTHAILTDLEQYRVRSIHARLLVTVEEQEHLALFLLCMHHLLRSSKRRLLILSSVVSQPLVITAWKTAQATDEGQTLAEQFPLGVALTMPLNTQTRVCLSTVRELQLLQIDHAQHISEAFDLVVAYDFPAQLSPVWKRVLEKLAACPLITFCECPGQEVVRWFENALIGEDEASWFS